MLKDRKLASRSCIAPSPTSKKSLYMCQSMYAFQKCNLLNLSYLKSLNSAKRTLFKREIKKKMQTTSCILERQMKDSEQIFLLYNCRFFVLINTQPGTFYFWDQISCFARSLKDQWLNLVESLHHYSLVSTTQTNATKTSLQI